MRVMLFILMLFMFIPVARAAENGLSPSQPLMSTHAPVEKTDQIYICPMHPHIHGKKGDKCPICGMDIVPQEQSENTTGPETKPASENTRKPATEQVYICAMHPNIHGKKGDKCPICGMDLVSDQPNEPMTMPGDQKSSLAPNEQPGSLKIKPDYIQALGVRTDKVSRHEFGKKIQTYGVVVPNARNEYSITMRANGWVRDLKTSAAGDAVKKGDLLFTVYSPDLMAAQADYLITLRGGVRIGDPEQRLRLFGMEDQAIALLKKKGEMLYETPFYAPVDGTLTSLNVRKGSYVPEGTIIMALQDLSKVWVNASIPSQDLPFLTTGTDAAITIAGTDQVYRATVDFIYPEVDSQSRKGTARLVLDNQDGKLRPNTPVNITFEPNVQSRISVPEEAILYDQSGGHVIASLGGGHFRPVSVKTGISSGGLTEITSGLSDGQTIVTSGQFMIDAESNLRGGMSSMADMSDMESNHAQ